MDHCRAGLRRRPEQRRRRPSSQRLLRLRRSGPDLLRSCADVRGSRRRPDLLRSGCRSDLLRSRCCPNLLCSGPELLCSLFLLQHRLLQAEEVPSQLVRWLEEPLQQEQVLQDLQVLQDELLRSRPELLRSRSKLLRSSGLCADLCGPGGLLPLIIRELPGVG
jgi:hypothetical protein